MKNNLIKKFILTVSIISSSNLLAFNSSPKKELLQDIKLLTKKCTIQIISLPSETKNENVIDYRSICDELKILSPNEAVILIDGEWLTASITEAAESDGGDLNNLTITNSGGVTLATKKNIAAYGSVLVAMAGDTEFRKINSDN